MAAAGAAAAGAGAQALGAAQRADQRHQRRAAAPGVRGCAAPRCHSRELQPAAQAVPLQRAEVAQALQQRLRLLPVAAVARPLRGAVPRATWAMAAPRSSRGCRSTMRSRCHSSVRQQALGQRRLAAAAGGAGRSSCATACSGAHRLRDRRSRRRPAAAGRRAAPAAQRAQVGQPPRGVAGAVVSAGRCRPRGSAAARCERGLQRRPRGAHVRSHVDPTGVGALAGS